MNEDEYWVLKDSPAATFGYASEQASYADFRFCGGKDGCGGWLHVSEFKQGNSTTRKRLVQSICRACERRIGNPGRKEGVWKSRLKGYGMSPDEYNMMLESQGGTCAIPSCSKDAASEGRRLAVDHCHRKEAELKKARKRVKGVVRGLLCAHHNLILGNCGDTAESVQELADYLWRFEKS